MKIKKGMYVRYTRGMVNEYVAPRIAKIVDCSDDELVKIDNGQVILRSDIIDKPSFNLIDLIEYMDLLEIEKSIKLYGENKTVALFNPVRCDGFTEFEDGTHCIILNLDYLVDVKDLKIKSVLTKEQFDSMKYVIKGDK